MDTKHPRYLHMFLVFVKIGLFTIGGGPAMIPLIRDEFVEKQKWIGNEDITDILALSQSLPGVIAVNASTFLGYRLGGLKGSLIATIGVVLPSFVIIFVIVTLFTASGFDQYPHILKFFDGVNSAITALLIAATLKLIPYSIKNNFGWFILAFALLGIYFFHLDIAVIVLLASLLGYVATKYLGRAAK
ncbi:MAG: chromate transporter [Acidaminococcaceae bacterium]|nr:chromate transporter [Acidaminococcaceae bacterium]